MYGNCYGNDWSYGTMGNGLLEGLFAIICLVLLVALVMFVIRIFSGRHHPRLMMGSSQALEILKARYARGEINKEEFEAKKRDLSGL